MEPSTDKDIVFSKSVIEFITVANEFCLFTEKAADYPLSDIMSFYQKLLPLLYIKGSLLPLIARENEIIAERYVTEEQWEIIYQPLHEKFAENDSITSVHKNEYDENVIAFISISDNLSDIYQDMKDFIMLYQKGTLHAKINAVNECRRLFAEHWGYRVVNVQRAIHYLLFPERDVKDEE
jgi:hypothetical protein